MIRSWRKKWDNLSDYFKYPENVGKGGFANKNSLLKHLYAGVLNAPDKWTHPVQNWNLTLSQMAIHFESCPDKHLDL